MALYHLFSLLLGTESGRVEGMRRRLGLWQDKKRESSGFGVFGFYSFFKIRPCNPHKLGE